MSHTTRLPKNFIAIHDGHVETGSPILLRQLTEDEYIVQEIEVPMATRRYDTGRNGQDY